MKRKRVLLDKVAIVTGASSGIGRETALALASEGANVTLAARRVSKLEEVAQAVRDLGRGALVVHTDVTRQDQVEEMVAKTIARWGRVDILVANAGIYVRSPVMELAIPEIERSMATNFYGAVFPALALLPHMSAQRSGHMIFVTSVDGKKGIPPDTPYVAAKFALTGFAEVLRQELRGTGVHVTNVLPGRVDTQMIAELQVPWISEKIPPGAVAQAIIRAIRQRPAEVFVPFPAKMLVYLNALSPKMGDWIAHRFHLRGWGMETHPRS